MKKRLTFFASLMLIITILISTFALPASANYNDELVSAGVTNTEVFYMENLDNGTIVFNKNSTKKVPMASLTKITTCMVVLENCKNLKEKITVKQELIDSLSGTGSSVAGIKGGEILSIEQLLYLMMVKSANEAAVILADYVGGGNTAKFIDMMNTYVDKLGCKNTHYTNPHGLHDPDHYTTAEDLAVITKKALKNDKFVEIAGTSKFVMPATNMHDQCTYTTTNFLMLEGSSYYVEGCKGIKTGTTTEAGTCLVSYATKNGYTYLCIALGAPKDNVKGVNYACKESKRAYDWAFSKLGMIKVASKSDIVTGVDVILAKKVDQVRLVPAEDVFALIPSNYDKSSLLIEPISSSLPEKLKAPIKAGKVIGKAEIKYAGDIVGTVDLVAGEDVKLGFFAAIGYFLKSFLTSTFMKIIYVVAAVLLAVILILRKMNKERREAQRIRVVNQKRQAPPSRNATQYSKNYKSAGYRNQNNQQSSYRSPRKK